MKNIINDYEIEKEAWEDAKAGSGVDEFDSGSGVDEFIEQIKKAKKEQMNG